MEKVSQSIIPSKRPLDDDDNRQLEEIVKLRKVVSKYPPPKMRNGVQVVRDFPPGCGTVENRNPLGKKADRVPLMDLDNNDSKTRKMMTSNAKNKLAESRCFEDDKVVTSKPKDFGGNSNTHLGSRPPTGKVQFRDHNLSKEGNAAKREVVPKVGSPNEQFRRGKVMFYDPRLEEGASKKPKDITTTVGSHKEQGDTKKPEDVTTTVGSRKEQVRREKINEAMTMFDEVYKKLFLENRSNPKGESIAHWRVTNEAAKIVKQKMKIIDANKDTGHIRGIQIGDKFKFRAQLQMVGLHCQLQSGIDYAKIRGKNLAISIVDSQRYSNERESSDVLLYSGQGGIKFFAGKQLAEDQKLVRGNLALKNSMDEKNPVRVIRKLHSAGRDNDVFVYDGLYIVERCTEKKGAEGKMVFMFQLKRKPGQPPLHKMLNANR